MQSWLKRHPVGVGVWGVVVFVVVTFPMWLAQVWPLASDRVFLDVMRENGWGAVIVGPYYGWMCVVIGIVLIGLVITAIASQPQVVEVEKIVEVEKVVEVEKLVAAEVEKPTAAIPLAAPPMLRTAVPIVAPGGPLPQIAVVAYDGAEAILFVHNTGGDAVFTADARIIKVDSGDIGHTAPYRMLWREIATHRVVKSHDRLIPSDGQVKLLIAYWASGGDWGKPSVVIIGDEWAVDSYRHDPWDKRSPTVTIEVTIKSVPPLASPFRSQYSLCIPPKTSSKVLVVDHQRSATP